MAKYSTSSPVEKNMFGGGKSKGTSLQMTDYKGEASVNKMARGPGAHNSLNSPAPSNFLKGMPDDDRQYKEKG